MFTAVEQVGEVVHLESQLPWVDDVVREAVGPQLRETAPAAGPAADVKVQIERSTVAFTGVGWNPIGRGSWTVPGQVVLENACASGFDLHVCFDRDTLTVRARWRPPSRERVASRVLRSRFHLLARCVLLQYPAMVSASRRGRAPLHAAACEAGTAVPLLVGPGGVGKSTLVLAEVERGALATSDNLCVSDGVQVFGLAEPARVVGASGRSMPHGRREKSVTWSNAPLVPDCLLVLQRVMDPTPTIRRLDMQTAARVLEAGTYSAGELRRFWGFASTLSLALPAVPPHPPIQDVATTLAARLPSFEVLIGQHPVVPLRDLLEVAGARR